VKENDNKARADLGGKHPGREDELASEKKIAGHRQKTFDARKAVFRGAVQGE
jgi:hypothetical protein